MLEDFRGRTSAMASSVRQEVKGVMFAACLGATSLLGNDVGANTEMNEYVARVEHELSYRWGESAALGIINEMLQRYPGAPEGHVLQAKVYLSLGDIGRALKCLEEAEGIMNIKTQEGQKTKTTKKKSHPVSSRMDPVFELIRAQVYYGGGKYHKAESVIQNASESSLKHELMGNIYLSSGRPELAVLAYGRAMASGGIVSDVLATNMMTAKRQIVEKGENQITSIDSVVMQKTKKHS